MCYMRLSTRKSVTDTGARDDVSKKNSETLENFSEKLEVEGRSLWQDARRRFMHNRAAVASLIVLVLIALFVIRLHRCFRSLPVTILTGR